MDWIKNLNEAINYIDENLQGEISHEKISQIAGCSIYNFQRVFSYVADRSLSEYIRQRKLTLAALDLLSENEKILEIGLKYGYESQDAFSRAFRNFHGVLPSVVRSEVTNLKACPKLSFQISIKGAQTMKYQIENWPSFKVAGFARKIRTEDAFQIVPQIWETAWKDGSIQVLFSLLQKTDYRPAGLLGIAASGEWGNSEEMEYIIAVTNDVDHPECSHVPALENMKEYTYPAADWVIINADGELPNAVQEVYKQFYSEWLPSSGYDLADLPVIESYMQNNRQEVWVAIKKTDKKTNLY